MERDTIERMIRQLADGLSTEQFEADQLRTLLADRDWLATALDVRSEQLHEALTDRDAARAERGNFEVQVRAYIRLLDAIGDAVPGATDPIAAVNRCATRRMPTKAN